MRWSLLLLLLVACGRREPVEAPDPFEVWKGRVEAQRDRLREAAAAEDWAATERQAAALLELDPIDDEAREVRASAAVERGHAARLEEARTRLSVGDDDGALERFLAIPRASAAYKLARPEVGRLAARIAGRARSDCLGYRRARDPERARLACTKALDLTCHEKLDRELLPQVRGWRCPVETAHWFREVPGPEALSAALGGRPAAEALAAFVASGDPSALEIPEAGAAAAQTAAGEAACLRGDTEGAAVAWEKARQLEAGFLPKGLSSARVAWLGRCMADGFLAAGERRAAAADWRGAHEAWRRGLAADSTNAGLVAGMQRLEAQARSLLAAAPGCAELALAAAITEEGSEVRRDAAARARERGCGT